MSKKKKRSGGLFLLVVVLGGLAAVGYGAGPGGWFTTPEAEALTGVPVRRGTLRISEVVRGNLKAKDSISLKNEIEGRTTILFLMEEGTTVAPGDLIAELDISGLDDNLVGQKISLQNSQADYTKAYEQYEIQVIQNESDIASAKMKITFAAIDLEKYKEGEWPQELQKAIEAIIIKEEELTQAKDKLEWTQKLSEKGFVQRTELEKDVLAVQRSEIELEQAKRDKDLKVTYENPRRVAELDADIEEMDRDLRRVEKQASAKLADYEAARMTTEAKLDLEKEKLRKIEEQIGKAKIFATEAGIVVYGRSRSSGRGWGGGEPIQEGSEINERQEIVSIPRKGGMIVEASLHETVLKRVAIGQPCEISVDALPGTVYQGRVDFVAVLPDSNSWYSNPNQRLYRAEISITDATLEMRPGMSCSVEILSNVLDDVPYVPVQSIFIDAGKTISFVKSGDEIEPRAVVVGPDNSKWVAIESGLEEGEIVLLSAPPSFTPTGSSGDGMEPAFESEGEKAATSIESGGPTANMGESKPGSDGGRRDTPEGVSAEAMQGLRDRSQHGGGERRGPPEGVTPEMIEKWKKKRGSGDGKAKKQPGSEDTN